MSEPLQEPAGKASVLVVDDDPSLPRAFARLLRNAGYDVQTASDGELAVKLLDAGKFDVVLSDISMPRMGGLDLLRAIRRRDLDLPLVLMTGSPALETALQAIESGALRYLVKPVDGAELVAVVHQAVRFHKLAVAKRQALELFGASQMLLGDPAGLEASFTRALDSLWMAFQPIVRLPGGEVFGYEALVRNEDSTLGRPDHLFDAAERLGRLEELGREIRGAFVHASPVAPQKTTLFLNLHPRDLLDETLYTPDAPLSTLARRVVLEITERASLSEVKDVSARISRLRKMGFRVALDDMGAGYAGLSSFAQLEPEFVKVDMSLVRDCDRHPTRQAILASFMTLCRDLGMIVLAEGVETPAERDTLVALGFRLFQGYLFGRPAKLAPAAPGTG